MITKKEALRILETYLNRRFSIYKPGIATLPEKDEIIHIEYTTFTFKEYSFVDILEIAYNLKGKE